MGLVLAPVRRRMLIGTFIAALALALVGPTLAFAANTASFSYRKPASGAILTTLRPTISVTVYDRYGIRGTGSYSMTLDGKTVKPSATYLVTGAWNPTRPDYRKVRLTYRVTSNLAPGSHRIYVRIRDLRRRYSTTAWYFKVKAPAPPYQPTFSLPLPAKGSSSTQARPTISLSGSDKYGVQGAGSYTMTIDGEAVTPSITYTTSGVYTSFKVTYRVPSNLMPGSHTVVVSTTDGNNITGSYSWSFTTVEPPLLPMPISGTACLDCHAGYPTAHPMTACAACHDGQAPTKVSGDPMSSYSPADVSAHTIGCALEACHGRGGNFPHVLDADCARCHGGGYAGIPPVHTLAVEDYHQSTSQFCVRSGCHNASLTLEHYRRTVDGVVGGTPLSCGTCHGSVDPAVTDAIADGSTACESCHDFGKITHPGTAAGHVASGTCIRSGCHVSNVVDVHAGNCTACHAPGKTASATCANCHATADIHSGALAMHTAASGGCVTGGCHVTDVTTIHAYDCSRCHAPGVTPSTVCATCHTGDIVSLHPDAASAHSSPANTCVAAGCHVAGVTDVHVVPGGPGCAACHADGVTPSIVCANCHTGDLGSVHSAAAAAHAAPASDCNAAGCHVPDVTAVHGAPGGPGCAACHGVGTTPSLVCSSCHPGEIAVIHAAAGAAHTAPIITCVSATCHASDVTAIHGKPGGPGCAACHAPDQTPATACAFCHAGDVTSVHSSADAKHVAPADLCATACHTGNVATIHAGGIGCVACHNSTGTTPATTCASCHAGDAPSLHASAAGFHRAPESGCVTSGCHTSDVTTLHATLTASGCAACHAPGKTPSILCADCHVGDVTSLHSGADAAHAAPIGTSCLGSSCHAANAATAHAAGPGCGACHTQDVTPSVVCATCHTGSISVLHARADTSHTAWNPTCVSAAPCHGSNVAVLHQSGPNCAACHRNGATPSLVCADCHAGDGAPEHVTIGVRHASPAGTCVTAGCHASDVVAVHASGPACAACHAEGKTASVTCTDCHSSDLPTAHAAGDRPHTAPAGYCIRSGCHVPSVTTLHAVPGCAACHAPGKTPSVICAACHSTDTSVLHAAGDVAHGSGTGLCVTSGCHSRFVKSVHQGKCERCHEPGTTPSVVCADCHSGLSAPTHASAESSHTAPAGLCVNSSCHVTNVTALHDSSTSKCAACHAEGKTPSLVCTTCHDQDPFLLHPTGAAKHLVGAGTCVAADCHATDVTAIHGGAGGPGCAACHADGTAPSVLCADCHSPNTTTVHADGDVTHNTTSATCIRSGCHVGSVVTLHTTGTTPPGCVVCHGPGATLSVVCGDADCHPGTSLQVHTPYIGTSHNSPAIVCSQGGCHGPSVAGIHGVNYPDGTPGPACAACHGEGKTPTVICTVCHAGDMTPRHASADSTHTAPIGTCVQSGCHSTNVSSIHGTGVDAPGCEACHGTGKTPSLLCASCHAGGFTSEHPAPLLAHTAVLADLDTNCVKAGCHGDNVATLHTSGTTPPGCAACHDIGKTASRTCSACHFSELADHPVPLLAHTAPNGTCVTAGCHGDNVATVHNLSASKCGACHGVGKTPSTTCGDCHTAGAYHVNAPVAHAAANGCIASPGCHATDVSTIHNLSASKCTACHAAGTTASKVCSSCHASQHVAAPAKHAVIAAGCNVSGCHATDVSAIHVKNSIQHCEACHAVGKTPSLTCATCHVNAGHVSSHDPGCNSCHNGDHWGGPTVGATDNWYPPYNDCNTCHNRGGSWTHPGVSCHGCDDPGGQVWTGIW